MPNTYTPIQTQTLASNTNTVTFSSISQSYTDLILVVSGKMSTSADIKIQIGNGSADTGTNYSRCFMFGHSGGVVSSRDANETKITASMYANPGSIIVNFMNYSNTTTFKPILVRNDISADITYASINMWRSTAAISYITLSHASYNFVAGSIFTLYGIAAA